MHINTHEVKHSELGKIWKHRLLEEKHPFNLNPGINGIKYLIIGTFNPEGYTLGARDENYFYGRYRNHFWEILPMAFGDASIKQLRNIEKWIKYLSEKSIGITDMLDYVSLGNYQQILETNYDDVPLDKCISSDDVERNILRLKEIIITHADTLFEGGIFLTRSTLQGIGQMRIVWEKVEEIAKQYHIRTGKLVTPARGRTYNGRHKSEHWREELFV